jgi:hypothetical protein
VAGSARRANNDGRSSRIRHAEETRDAGAGFVPRHQGRMTIASEYGRRTRVCSGKGRREAAERQRDGERERMRRLGSGGEKRDLVASG